MSNLSLERFHELISLRNLKAALSNRLGLGFLLLAPIAVMAILSPWLGTIDPAAVAPTRRLMVPSDAAWFGTDMLGRDVYSRTLYGARVSLLVGLAATTLAFIIGTSVGLVAGFFRHADAIIMRIVDGVMSIPSMLLAISIMALTQGSIGNVVLAIALASFPRIVRLVRSVVLTLREQLYVEAAIAAGATSSWILLRHIFPNALAPLLVQLTFVFASAMLSEASLSFIGAGVPPVIPTWGNIVADGRTLWQLRPNIIFFPAAFLCLTVLAVNLIGDGLRDALDPRVRRIV